MLVACWLEHVKQLNTNPDRKLQQKKTSDRRMHDDQEICAVLQIRDKETWCKGITKIYFFVFWH
jgi:hypothetical protein